jgi:hypothetical protein
MEPKKTEPTEAPMPHVEATLKEESLPTQRIKPLYRISQTVWYILAVIEFLLGLRFFLKLFAANPQAGFTQFIYGSTQLFAGPFLYVFRVSQVQGNIFEWSTLLAMAIYFLVVWMIVQALVISKPVSTKEANQKLPEQGKL